MSGDRRLCLESQLKIEFLPPNSDSEKCLRKFLLYWKLVQKNIYTTV